MSRLLAVSETTGQRATATQTLARAIARRLDDRVLLVISAVALLVSLALPYWHMTLLAPQYPGGLKLAIYLGPKGLTGDVAEIDGLNHYIGMMKLESAAPLERSIAPFGILALAGLSVVAAVVRRRWTVLLVVPVVLFPFVFLADLAYWLWYFGHHLDPSAALSSAIRPFTPPVLGTGRVGQFSVVASFGVGLYLAFLAALAAAMAGVRRWCGDRNARTELG